MTRYICLFIAVWLCVAAPTSMSRKPTSGEVSTRSYLQHSRYRGVRAHWMMHEGGGITVRSLVMAGPTNHNEGLLENMDPNIDWVPCLWGGRCVDFDGIDDKITLNQQSDEFDGTGDLTISAWIKPRTFGENGFGRIYDNDNLIFIVSDTADTFAIASDGSNFSGSVDNTIVDNQWQLVTIRRPSSGSGVTHFHNGVEVTGADTISGTPAAPAGSTSPGIGNQSNDTTNRTFDGLIDNLIMWDRLLTPAEIRSLYTDPFLEFHQPAFWDMIKVAVATARRRIGPIFFQ